MPKSTQNRLREKKNSPNSIKNSTYPSDKEAEKKPYRTNQLSQNIPQDLNSLPISIVPNHDDAKAATDTKDIVIKQESVQSPMYNSSNISSSRVYIGSSTLKADPTTSFGFNDSKELFDNKHSTRGSSKKEIPVKSENTDTKVESKPLRVTPKSRKINEQMLSEWAIEHNKTIRKKTINIKPTLKSSASLKAKSQLELKLERIRDMTLQGTQQKPSVRKAKLRSFTSSINKKSETQTLPAKSVKTETVLSTQPAKFVHSSIYTSIVKRELSTEEHYSQLEAEAFQFWKAQLKVTESPFKKRNEMLCSFVNGTAWDKLNIIIINYLDLVQELPVIFSLIEQQSLLQKSFAQKSLDFDKSFSNCVSWIKLKCVILASTIPDISEYILSFNITEDEKDVLGLARKPKTKTDIGEFVSKVYYEIDQSISLIINKLSVFTIKVEKTVQVLVFCKKSLLSLFEAYKNDKYHSNLIFQQLLNLYAILTEEYSSYFMETFYQILDLQFLPQNNVLDQIADFGLTDLYITLLNYVQNMSSKSGLTAVAQNKFSIFDSQMNSVRFLFSSNATPRHKLTIISLPTHDIVQNVIIDLLEYIDSLVKVKSEASGCSWYNPVCALIGLSCHFNVESMELGFVLCLKLAKISNNFEELRLCLSLSILLIFRSSSSIFGISKDMMMCLLDTKLAPYLSLFIVFLYTQSYSDIQQLFESLSITKLNISLKKFNEIQALFDLKNEKGTQLFNNSLLTILSDSYKIDNRDSIFVYKSVLLVLTRQPNALKSAEMTKWISRNFEFEDPNALPMIFEIIKKHIDSNLIPLSKDMIKQGLENPFVSSNLDKQPLSNIISQKYLLTLFYVLYLYHKNYDALTTNSLLSVSFQKNKLDSFMNLKGFLDKEIDLVPASLVFAQLEFYRSNNPDRFSDPFKTIITEIIFLVSKYCNHLLDPLAPILNSSGNTPFIFNSRPPATSTSVLNLEKQIQNTFSNNKKDFCLRHLQENIELLALFRGLPVELCYQISSSFISNSFSKIIVLVSSFVSQNEISTLDLEFNKELDFPKDTTPDSRNVSTKHSFVGSKKNFICKEVGNLIIRFVEEFFVTWEYIFSINTVQTALITAKSILFSPLGPKQDSLTIEQLWLNPLVLLKSNVIIFSHPCLASIFVMVTKFLLDMSKKKYGRLFTEFKNVPLSPSFKPENFATIALLQEVSVIHMLFDTISILSKNGIPVLNSAVQNTTKQVLFNFINQMIIQNEKAFKLVCFETFDRSLVKDTILCVPAFSCCSNFLQELITLPILDKSLFGLDLWCSISEHYPTVNKERLARDFVLKHISAALNFYKTGTYKKADTKTINDYITFIIRTVSVFPPLTKTAVSVIENLSKDCGSIVGRFRLENTNQEFTKQADADKTIKPYIVIYNISLFKERLDNAIVILGLFKGAGLDYTRSSAIVTADFPPEIKQKKSSDKWVSTNQVHSFTLVDKFSDPYCFKDFMKSHTNILQTPANLQMLEPQIPTFNSGSATTNLFTSSNKISPVSSNYSSNVNNNIDLSGKDSTFKGNSFDYNKQDYNVHSPNSNYQVHKTDNTGWNNMDKQNKHANKTSYSSESRQMQNHQKDKGDVNIKDSPNNAYSHGKYNQKGKGKNENTYTSKKTKYFKPKNSNPASANKSGILFSSFINLHSLSFNNGDSNINNTNFSHTIAFKFAGFLDVDDKARYRAPENRFHSGDQKFRGPPEGGSSTYNEHQRKRKDSYQIYKEDYPTTNTRQFSGPYRSKEKDAYDGYGFSEDQSNKPRSSNSRNKKHADDYSPRKFK
ncbi:hypothetical protein BB560_001574 [Smittium megazygosporum]|uniref:Uncharacterized protein n=1 Tax=Smittium megazygosporum TaxID=133381 RepID=A0A2T9ZH62_9FUNG|nr:hypothetical protein BB560_001574 [Smittium megazygosporum]